MMADLHLEINAHQIERGKHKMKKKSNAKKETKKIQIQDGISISRIYNYSDECTFFNLHIEESAVGEITIYGCTLVSTDKKDFISLPSRKGDDDKYYSHVFFKIDDALKDKIIDAISDNI